MNPIYDTGLSALKPDKKIETSEWADAKRYLTAEISNEDGPWRTSRTPYLKFIMDALSPHSKWRKVVFMKASRIGGTEVGNNWLGSIMDHYPAPTMMIMPTDELMKHHSNTVIKSLIESTPSIKNKIVKYGPTEAGNSKLFKKFPRGYLLMTGGLSPSSYRNRTIKNMFIDDANGLPGDVGGEGDPVKLAINRTRTYRHTKKIYINSTGTIVGDSRISNEIESTTQYRCYLPCPHCNVKQLLWFTHPETGVQHLKWDGDNTSDAYYVCEHCKKRIDEHHKDWMLSNHEWVKIKDGNPDELGVFLSSLYSPIGWYSWSDIAKEFVEAMKALKKGNAAKMKTLVNTTFGEDWEERGEAPPWRSIHAKREAYKKNVVPDGGLILLAFTDCQADRFEVEIVAYGREMESWSIDYRVIMGDTSKIKTYDELKPLFQEKFKTESGHEMQILRMGIDSGYNTHAVYTFGRNMGGGQVIVTKGIAKFSVPVGQPRPMDINYDGKKITSGVSLWGLGVQILKTELYSFLRLEKNEDGTIPYGYMHFPNYEEEYFKMLTAEENKRKIDKKGYSYWEFHKIRERNEALDIRVGIRALTIILGVDRFTETHWQQLESDIKQTGQINSKQKSGRRIINKGIGY